MIASSRVRPVQWVLRPPAPLGPLEALSRTLGLSPRLASVLYSRGIHSVEALEPPLELSPNPALLEAGEQIARAIRAGKRIRVHGDYDADGVTAASVLVTGLRELGAEVHAFIPHRMNDGYGINPDRVPEHIEACELFITVDCGVSNLDEIKMIVAAGLEAIVTDHHAPGEVLPGCLVVHPALAPNYHHDLPALTGSGVAFHLLWATRRIMGFPPPLEYADLAAIGTIADLAPLLGENRALVKAGLERMRDSRWTGIRAMLEQARVTTPTARDVGFIIAPRINAAGRLGEAETALELLTTSSAQRALTLATYLDARNLERKKIQEDMFQEALLIADPAAPALVVTKTGWHPGVMGIVASKLLERFYKPVFIIAEGKGSVRTTPGFSAVKALSYAKDTLKRYGGHSQAGGFALFDHNIAHFENKILEFAHSQPEPQELILADALLSPTEISKQLIKQLETLEPFGQGNPAPIFWLRETLESAGGLGKEGKHFQYKIGGLRGKQWSVGVPFMGGDAVDAAVQLEENTWQGRTTLEYSTVKMRYQGRVGLLMERGENEENAPEPFSLFPRIDTKIELERLQLEPCPVFASGTALEFLKTKYPGIPLAGDEIPECITLISLPEPTQLETWLRAGIGLRFALTPKTLCELETREALTLERLHDIEARAKKGEEPPAQARRLLEAIRGLSITEAYQVSADLRREELEAYRLRTFARLYRIADDIAFSSAVRTLWASGN
jgi:single-stranded-DNA-specific exonuclease